MGLMAPLVFSSPQDIDGRWSSHFKTECEYWIEGFKTKHDIGPFDRSSCREKLLAVLKRCWKKWDIATDLLPLPADEQEQVSGKIMEDLLAELAPIVNHLSAPKKHHAAKL